MKKFNNNFTTPEQSKRLLELGVPEWTADCFRWDFGSTFCVNSDKRYSTSISTLSFEYQMDFHDKLPCWSVGRLIEIMKICSNGVATWYLRSTDKEPLIEQWIDFLESGLFEKDFDFSKLDE